MTRADWSYIMITVPEESDLDSHSTTRLSASRPRLNMTAHQSQTTNLPDAAPWVKSTSQASLILGNERTNKRTYTLKLSEEALVGDSD